MKNNAAELHAEWPSADIRNLLINRAKRAVSRLAESNFMRSKTVTSSAIFQTVPSTSILLFLQRCVIRTNAANYALQLTVVEVPMLRTRKEVPPFHLLNVLLEHLCVLHSTFCIHLAIFFPRVVVVMNFARNKHFGLGSKV